MSNSNPSGDLGYLYDDAGSTEPNTVLALQDNGRRGDDAGPELPLLRAPLCAVMPDPFHGVPGMQCNLSPQSKSRLHAWRTAMRKW